MTSRTRIATAGAATVAAAVAAAMLLPVSSGSQAPATGPDLTGADRVGCSEQSSAGFPGAYRSRRNLVAGPLAMIGAGSFTSEATVRRFGGNKFPLLVRAGHKVTMSIPPPARATAALSYGSHADGDPDPQHTIVFSACSQRRSGSRADERRVTFWSGFVLASAPICVPLDVYVDGATAARRVHIALGRRCQQPPPPLRDCATHIEGGKPSDQLPRQPGTVTVGPFEFAGLGRVASRRGLEHHRAPRGGYAIKSGVGVAAGARATLSIARSARGWASLNYAPQRPDRRDTRSSAVRFEACAADHPAFSYDGPVGPRTWFSGGFELKRRGCLPLEARVPGRPVVRVTVPFGVGRCPSAG